MEIVRLTTENIAEYAYPCMMKKTRWVKHPERYRAVSLSFLQKTLGQSVLGICAIKEGKSVGHLFYGPLKGAGFPVRCREENIPAVFCTHVRPSFARQGAGRAMVEAAVEACQDAPGLLVLASGMKSYMPIEPFLQLGFQMIHEDGFWKIGYYPIQKASVHVETYTPELEWDYIKSFTFITGDFCPFLVHLREEQKKCASRFHEQLPIEETRQGSTHVAHGRLEAQEVHQERRSRREPEDVRDDGSHRIYEAEMKQSRSESMEKSEKDTLMIAYTTMDSAVGRLLIASTDHGLLGIGFLQNGVEEAVSRLEKAYPGDTLVEDLATNRDALNQLQEYFQGRRRVFTLPLELRGTEFQRSVWEAVAGVPYGETRSYGYIARKLGKPKAYRAVGAANGANPIPIVIPCHRIIGSDGSMTGFGGGIPIKEKLLVLEKAWMIKENTDDA